MGPHTVDRVSSHYNAQVHRFNSHFACPGTEAVDAFTVHWGGENNWWCSPPILVLRHAKLCGAFGTLVVPCWESAPYWPLLCPDSNNLAQFVKGFCLLPVIPGLFKPGKSGSVLFEGNSPNTAVFPCEFSFDLCGLEG